MYSGVITGTSEFVRDHDALMPLCLIGVITPIYYANIYGQRKVNTLDITWSETFLI